MNITYCARTHEYYILTFICAVKPVLSSHPREAQNVAAWDSRLLTRGEYQYKIKVLEHSV